MLPALLLVIVLSVQAGAWLVVGGGLVARAQTAFGERGALLVALMCATVELVALIATILLMSQMFDMRARVF